MTDNLRAAIEGYVARWGLGGNHAFYTPKEWQGRGEEVGQYADLTLTCEGDLYGILNGHASDSRQLMDDFSRTVEGAGYWWMQGTTWSVHFYRREKQ